MADEAPQTTEADAPRDLIKEAINDPERKQPMTRVEGVGGKDASGKRSDLVSIGGSEKPAEAEVQVEDYQPPKMEPAGFGVTPKQSRMRGETTFNKLPRVQSDEDYNQLPAGQRFMAPDGTQRQKPWSVSTDADYDKVPEGQQFLDPEGNLRVKPTYAGVDLTTQTLWDMASNDKERRKILARGYGEDAIKEDHHGELYVQTPDGQRRKPGRDIQALGGFLLAGAAPTAGAVGGELLAPIGGGMAGAVAGQHLVNDAILGLAGVYDRDLGEEMANVATTGTLTAAGSLAGRLVGGPAGVVAAAPGDIKGNSGKVLAKYVGADADPDATARAARLSAQGVKVPPSAWMKESPYIHTVVETFDPKFRTQQVLRESAVGHYEKEAARILEESVGVKPMEKLTAATKPVSSEEAGQRILARARDEMAAADGKLQKAMEEATASHRAKLAGMATDHEGKLEALRAAQEEAKKAAQTIVDAGFKSIEQDIATATKAAKAGDATGDIVRAAEQKIRSLNQAIKARAGIIYNAADKAAGDARPTLEFYTKEGTAQSLTVAAKDFMEQLPKSFQDKYPDIVSRIHKLKPGETTFGQLRQLRTLIRSDIDYNDLLPSVREGAYKRFAGLIDNVIHSQKDPQLVKASQILDAADDFYSKNIRKFKDEVVKWITGATESGWAPDATMIAKEALTGDQAERISGLRKVLGPGLWNAVTNADTQRMLDAARTTIPGEYDAMKFAEQVIDRERRNVIKNAYSPELAAKVRQQANRILAMNGKIPLRVLEGDNMATIMDRANRAALEIETATKIDPLGSLTKDIKKIEGRYRGQRMEMMREMRKDPLRFIYEAGALPTHAADKILADPDLFMAAARKFGVNSPEFEMLRQVAAMRLFQTSNPASVLGKFTGKQMPESVQNLIFPGVSRDDAVTLAKDMEFLLGHHEGDRSGASIAAQSRVLHPTGHLLGGGVLKHFPNVPGVGAAARSALSKYYAFVTNAATNPTVVRFIADGLKGTDQERLRAWQMFQQWSRAGGMIGAGGAQMIQESENE